MYQYSFGGPVKKKLSHGSLFFPGFRVSDRFGIFPWGAAEDVFVPFAKVALASDIQHIEGLLRGQFIIFFH